MASKSKRITLIILVFLLALTILCCSGCKKKDESKKTSNEEAEEKKDESRFITIINGTDSSTINKVEVLAGEGIFVVGEDNPDEKSFSYKIGDTWKDYDSFTIVLTDVYGLKFEQTINNFPAPGKMDIKITEDDYVEQPGDWSRLLERTMNEKH